MRNWKQASSYAIAFAYVATCQNAIAAKAQPVELDAQAAQLTLEHIGAENAPNIKRKTASSVKPATAASTAGLANSKTVSKASAVSPVATNNRTSPNKTAASSTSTSKDSVPKSAKENSKPSEPKPAESKTASGKTGRKASPKRVMLVPPPPPTMPTYLNATSPIAGSFDLGLSVNFMSLEDLKFQQKTLQTKLEAAKLDEQDEARSNNEKKDRAQRFVELYKEGVVSRRELETAQQESERAIRDSGQSHIKVTEIDRVLKQVKDRISSMESAKRPAKVSSKKSKTR